jgi:hypothetical protein
VEKNIVEPDRDWTQMAV